MDRGALGDMQRTYCQVGVDMVTKVKNFVTEPAGSCLQVKQISLQNKTASCKKFTRTYMYVHPCTPVHTRKPNGAVSRRTPSKSLVLSEPRGKLQANTRSGDLLVNVSFL